MAHNKMFEPDSPMMTGFQTVRDLLVLNILTILCALPMVTIVPAFTALHYTCIKMVRNEEGYVSKDFFKSFRENLKQGIWSSVIFIAAVIFIGADFYAISLIEAWFANVAFALLLTMCAVFLVTCAFFFPCMAKLTATLKQNMANAFKMGASHIVKTILITIITLLPFVICFYIRILSPLLFFFGLSVPAFICAFIYNPIFKKLEDDWCDRPNV